ncbi:MAG TPA: hypothetical protein PKE16_09490 [Hyphomicrobium sp.]|nr:hypothetical protein [Hyphomicrobium sp.]
MYVKKPERQLSLEELNFLYDYVCFLSVHGLKQTSVLLDRIERAIADAENGGAAARAEARVAARLGKSA